MNVLVMSVQEVEATAPHRLPPVSRAARALLLSLAVGVTVAALIST
jgi:hypothetical protein